MKRKKLLLMLLLAFALPWAAMAQGTLPIGTGTSYSTSSSSATGSGSAMGNCYNYYSTSQFIYTAEELGGAKTINSIAFNHNAYSMSASVNIYLAHTTATTVDVNNPATGGTLVSTLSESSIGGSAEGWQTFNFSTPFEYNGTDNLLVIVSRSKYNSGWSNYLGWQYTATSDNKFMTRNSDDSGYDDITNTSYSYTAYANRPNVIIGYVLTTPYVTLDPASATVITGSSTTLTATYGNVTGTPTITYTSSNTNVAMVSGNGTTATVTGVASGTATITATMNGSYTATCTITVEDPSYCTPYYSQTSDYIKSFVTTGGATNISNTNTGQGTGGYSDFYNSHYASISEGEALSFTVTRGYDDSYKYAIWVDWNHDYVFDVDTETVAEQTTSVSGDWSSSFTVPAGTAVGDYRMRVEMLYGSSSTLNPCVSATYGEVEDYKLTVIPYNPCGAPTNLTETQVGTTTAVLNWEGENDSYVLQYRAAAQDMNMGAWHQIGEDVVTTHDYTQYTFDLSDFAGQTGYVAIRHYAVSDMFVLAIDDIVLTNANNEIVWEQGFDDGNIPTGWANIDLDGDGYTWGITTSDLVNGYCAYSESYSNATYNALFPDNWLVIPNVELGGTMTLYAVGLDSQGYHLENFGVFVTTASSLDDLMNIPAGEWSDEIPVATTSRKLTGLTASTPYDWRVKGICNGYSEPSFWATSSFTTVAEGFKTFVTAGDWNVADNWFPEGVPTLTDEVTITKAASIPANCIAQAKKAIIETGGSITIEDGGQLKQGSATLKVTMKKNISGIGQDNWENEDYRGGWNFISTPFSGRTQFSYASNWSHVLHLTEGDYDLYGFDPTSVGEEWINYQSHPEHSLFTSSNNIEGLQDGDGYLYANKEDKILEFTGTATSSHNSSKNITYTYNSESTDPFNGWRLVGNPFTCNAYINYVDGENVLEADFYVMNTDGDGYELPQSSVALPPLTGALINFSATGTVRISTEASAKSNSSGILNMTVSNGRSSVDMARVRFGRGYNLKHMSFRNNSSKLFIPVDVNDYAVVCTKENVGEMPVNFKAETNGTYTIRFNTENVEFSYLHFIDNLTGNDVNLLETPSYTFNAQTTDYANRFRLVFATGSSVDGENFGFVNGMGNLCIFGIEGEATIQVIDILGHVVTSDTFSGSYERKLNVAPGVYMIRLINGNDVKVQKIVVR